MTAPNLRWPVLAGLVPALAYLATASGYAHWFDTGEFVAAAMDFGIAHPPGHPLSVLVLGAANLLPFGSLAFRIAVMTSLCTATAVSFLFAAMHHSLRSIPAIAERLVLPLSLAAAWWVAGSYAWWVQAVRPEVYALQALVLCVIFERLCWMHLRDYEDVRPLYHASFALGLGLANHHYMAAVCVPVSVWLLLPILRTRGPRPFAFGTGFVLAGLLPYIFLPLRSLQEPFLNLGNPTSGARLWWVISAKAFQKSVDSKESGAFGDRLMDVLLVLTEGVHIATFMTALLGVYLMLRLKESRRLALFWLSAVVLYVLGRALLGFTRGNPDAAGYFMPAFAGVALFAVFAIGAVLTAVSETRPQFATWTRYAAVAACVLAVGQFPRTLKASSLHAFVDTDVLDDEIRRNLPHRAVVFAHNPQTLFRYWGGEAEEWTRPDVTFVPLAFATYPGFVESLVKEHPELKPTMLSYLVRGELRRDELMDLAATRPVLVEMDTRVPASIYEDLVPHGLYHALRPGGVTDADERIAAKHHANVWRELYAQVGQGDPHTETQLIWRHYNDALYFLHWNDRAAADRTVKRGLALNPSAQELKAMRRALDTVPPDQKIAIEPFQVVVD